MESTDLANPYEGEIAENGLNQCFNIVDNIYYYEDHVKEMSDNKKPFLHIGQEQFLDDEIRGDINDSNDGKKNFRIYNTMLKNNKESYGVYIKNSLHYSYTDLKLIYRAGSPLSIPLNSLGRVDKQIVDAVMDKTVLDFFNYALKNQDININDYNTYNGQVIYNKYP